MSGIVSQNMFLKVNSSSNRIRTYKPINWYPLKSDTISAPYQIGSCILKQLFAEGVILTVIFILFYV